MAELEYEARAYSEFYLTPSVAIEPRDYQQDALSAWHSNNRQGSVVLPTGSGKTFLAIQAIADARVSTLVVVPTIDLMNQWHALSRMPVEEGDTILDFGTGSGYALRALRETQDIGISVGLDGSPEMVRSTQGYTTDSLIQYLTGDFHQLPFGDETIDHIWSMEAFYYSQNPIQVLEEIERVLRSGGTFFRAVNFFQESQHTHR